MIDSQEPLAGKSLFNTQVQIGISWIGEILGILYHDLAYEMVKF